MLDLTVSVDFFQKVFYLILDYQRQKISEMCRLEWNSFEIHHNITVITTFNSWSLFLCCRSVEFRTIKIVRKLDWRLFCPVLYVRMEGNFVYFIFTTFLRFAASILNLTWWVCILQRTLFRPTREWGPALVKHRQLITHLGANFVVDPWTSKANQVNTTAKYLPSVCEFS